MKARSLKIVLTALFLTCIMVSYSFATAFLNASVTRAKTTDGMVEVMLDYIPGGESGDSCTWSLAGGTGGATSNHIWFTGTANMDDQALAIALTAISLTKTVRMGIEQCPTTAVQKGTFSSIGLNQ